MSGSKAPDFDAYGLLRATHSHNPTQGLSPTYEQAHVGLDLLTLASFLLLCRSKCLNFKRLPDTFSGTLQICKISCMDHLRQ